MTPGKSNWKYDWDFGDGNKVYNVTEPYGYEYKKWGSYIIILKAYDDQCNDTVKHTVTIVSGKPVAKYDSDSAFAGCVPHTMTFINQSKGADWFLWKFGDGGAMESDTIEDITYTYRQPGTYLVELMAMTLTDTTIISDKTVTVHPKPIPFFHVAPPIVEAFNEMKCINVTSNAARYLWEFGDGKSDTIAEPTHIYTDEGKYDITLYAWTEYECTDTITIKDAIEVEPSCRLIFPNAFTPSKSGATGGKYNLEEKETTNDIFHPITKNIVNYQLEIYSRWGELLFITKDISIGWDGYFKNVLVKDDVYIWKVKGTCFNGKEIVQTGTVIVVR
jgi:PKD repeat protein